MATYGNKSDNRSLEGSFSMEQHASNDYRVETEVSNTALLKKTSEYNELSTMYSDLMEEQKNMRKELENQAEEVRFILIF